MTSATASSEDLAMTNNDLDGSTELARLRGARARINELLPRLQKANEAFAAATLPLAQLSELDSDHRQELAARIRAANREWKEVTDLIHQALTG
jgi:hypothetical protein